MINRNTIVHPKCFNSLTGRTQLNKLHVSIQQSLRLIITTTKGELLGDPNFGSNLSKFIYETNCDIQWVLIRDDLRQAIAEYETRIEVVDILFNNPNENTLSITIEYKLSQIEGEDGKGDITFSILLPNKNDMEV